MKIKQIDENSFTLQGKIKEISDYHDLKSLLEKRRKAGQVEVHFNIPQAREIHFFILGYWLKLACKDGFKIHLYVTSPYLYDNLLRFGLHIFFEVKNDDMAQYL
ncbi:hypothetical protein LS70_008790 [Helicobacter sp. MIT 11-5569]|uniref:hypothetical protein n=1 Tax=Helicobacter sp. MIT 11-5569 TaxID=1548151 RepID=UPI00051FC576|nr:hypothetical protein [Helicobacter sp. MIT 11-5569]TLD80657.1 hypothetical protein LS70_008790 [Helicobacter sp. MIT 11-5569]